jgi:hypothetical protein
LSTDLPDPRLAAQIAIISRIARNHAVTIDSVMADAAVQAGAQVEGTSEEIRVIKTVLWGVYFAHLFGHFASIAGPDVATNLLHQLLIVQSGERRGH